MNEKKSIDHDSENVTSKAKHPNLYNRVVKARKSLERSKSTNPVIRIVGIGVLYIIEVFLRVFFYRQERPKSALREWIELIVSIVIIVFFIRLAVVEAFRIPTSSMEDTLLVGDFLLVNKFVYGIRSPDWIGVPFTKLGFFVPFFRLPSFSEPKQGDIVVFRFPLDKNLSYIKRCIATEGQTVEIRDKVVYVDGVPFENPRKSKFTSGITYPRSYVERAVVPRNLKMRNRDNFGPLTIPAGHFFVMGDNRDNSADSRYWGFLPRDLIIGKALIIYFSWDKYLPVNKLNNKIRWERIGNLIR